MNANGFANLAFALFATLLMAGSLFATAEANTTLANHAPVITGTGGPSSLNAGETGTWSVSAYDPDGNYLSYSVSWGDNLAQSQAGQSASSSTATFQHSYSSAGTYTIRFTVTDSAGAKTESTITTTVGTGTTPSGLLGKISYWWGKVNLHYSNGAWSSDPDGSSGASLEMLSYCNKWFPGTTELKDGGLETTSGWQTAGGFGSYTTQKPVYLCYASALPGSATGAVYASNHYVYQGDSLSVEGNVRNTGASTQTYKAVLSFAGEYPSASDEERASAYPAQEVSEEFSLASGETRKLSADFTAKTLVYNFAKISVYLKTDSGYSLVSQAIDRVTVMKKTSSNQAPVITGSSFPSELYMNEVGTWKISAYDPDGSYLAYSVVWGDTGTKSAASDTGSSATFQHSYSNAGTYGVTITVADANGSSAQKSGKVTVKENGITPINSSVYATVSANPLEVEQYEKVQVNGKVARVSDSTSDSPLQYKVVLSLDNGNNREKVYATTASGTAATASEPVSVSGASSVQAIRYPYQDVQYVQLSPGESKELSAVFTAQYLGTNFAKIEVYQEVSGVCASGQPVASASGQDIARPCRIEYRLVASDTQKVKVTNNNIPPPPSEKLKITLYPGWNMVSNPRTSNLELRDISAKCNVAPNAWLYSPLTNSYSQATTLYSGMGYWLRADEKCTFEVSGPFVEKMSIGLNAGWNMIGATGTAVPFSSMSGNCRTTSGPWYYSPDAGQYSKSSRLEPGKAYWVKVANDCTMSTSPSVSEPPMPPSE